MQEIEELVKKAKGRDPDAFTRLMQFYMEDMYRVAIAILMNDEDVADAIQDTILTCWEKIDRLREDKYFRTWMTRILINKSYDIRKKRGNIIGLEGYDQETVANDCYNFELKEALMAMDEKYRAIMILFYSEGYRIKEIAKFLHIPQSTVQTRLKRGREWLAKYYGVKKE